MKSYYELIRVSDGLVIESEMTMRDLKGQLGNNPLAWEHSEEVGEVRLERVTQAGRKVISIGDVLDDMGCQEERYLERKNRTHKLIYVKDGVCGFKRVPVWVRRNDNE